MISPRERGIKRFEDEQEVLSQAVGVALHTFMSLCGDDGLPAEVRIDAASRILGYAASFGMIEDEIETETEMPDADEA